MTQPTETALNVVDARVFPPTSRRGSTCGEFKVQEIKARELVETYGSPLYVVDEPAVRAKARSTREAFEAAFAAIGTRARVFYASKALLNVPVVQWMADEGLGVDVASEGELAVALAAGVDPALIGMHGNNKSLHEIEMAVVSGVGTIVIDSEQEIERVAAVAKHVGVVQNVMLRVNSGVHASTHDFLATSHEDQKFGLPLNRTEHVVASIRSHPSLNFLGLHCHIGSQIFASDGFRESARRLLEVYPALLAGGSVPELNLGGGFGIAYTPEEAELVPEAADLAPSLASIVQETCAELGISVPNVSFEPGRSIVGQAGVTIYTVGTTKPVAVDEAVNGAAQRLYVSVDGGMSDNARPALYGAKYHARIGNRRSEAAPALTRIVGKHCEAGDVIIDEAWLPGDIEPGDLLVVAGTGAYCWSLSSNYNYVTRPPMVAVADGKSRIIVRGQTIAELVAQSLSESAKNGA